MLVSCALFTVNENNLFCSNRPKESYVLFITEIYHVYICGLIGMLIVDSRTNFSV